MPSTNVPGNAAVISESRDALESNISASTAKPTFFSALTEDWWAVIIGGFLIAVILVFALALPGFKFTTPVFQWADTNDLFLKVLAVKNLLLIAGIGLVFMVLASISIALSRGSASRFVRGFGLIFVLGLLSLVVAGNKSISYYGIEYVVFA